MACFLALKMFGELISTDGVQTSVGDGGLRQIGPLSGIDSDLITVSLNETREIDLVRLVVDQFPPARRPECQVDYAMEDARGPVTHLDLDCKRDLHETLVRGSRPLPELRRHHTLDGVEGLRDNLAQLGLAEGEPVRQALEVGAVAQGAAHGVLEQRVNQAAPGDAGVGLSGAALRDRVAVGIPTMGGPRD